MKYFNLYRISTYLLIIFAVTHTFGGLLSKKSLGPEADAVLASMKEVHFNFMGADSTYYGFYFGFGLVTTLFLLFSAVVTWYLGGLRPEERVSLSPISWALFVSYVLMAVLSWVYFFAGPGVTSTIVAVLLGIACIRTPKRIKA